MTRRIAIDLRQATGSPTGIGRYLVGLANAAVENGLEVRAYVAAESPTGLDERIELHHVRTAGPRWHFDVWRDLRRNRLPYLSNSLMISQMPGIRALPAVLDVVTFLFPEYHTLRTKIPERVLMRRAIRRWPIVTCSEATAVDLRQVFGGDPSITVVPPALFPTSSRQLDPADPPYLLYVGTLEPRKNLATAIRAVRRLVSHGRDLRLVVVGKIGWHSGPTRTELDGAVTEGFAEWRGYVTDEERDRLYEGASALLMPSVHEGFGLPVLEAMQRGVACICSDAAALVEASGGAAIHVPAFDEAEWVRAIESLMESPSERAQLVERGRRRAAEFDAASSAAALGRALDALA